MSIDQATVRHIARLARIKVSDAEARKLEGELSAILTWVEQLDSVDTNDIEPMTSVIEVDMKKRSDEVTDGGMPETIVGNAPERDNHFFLVPKVVE